jgi:hypothetical protein
MTTITAPVSDALADLARTWGDRDSTERAERLSLLVHPSLTGIALADAFADYMSARLALDDFDHGMSEWRDVHEDWGSALFSLCGDVDAALKTLTDGPRRGAGETGTR